jgi:hypothetical protein
MSRSLLLNINLNLSKSDILIKLKTQFDLENYLCADVNKKSISTFVKIRISNSNLNIEKGRYLNTLAYLNTLVLHCIVK